MEWVLWPPGRVSHFFVLKIYNFTVVFYVIWAIALFPWVDCVIYIWGFSWCLAESLDQRSLVLGFAFHLVIHGLDCWSMFYLDLINCNEMLYSEITVAFYRSATWNSYLLFVMHDFVKTPRGSCKQDYVVSRSEIDLMFFP